MAEIEEKEEAGEKEEDRGMRKEEKSLFFIISFGVAKMTSKFGY